MNARWIAALAATTIFAWGTSLQAKVHQWDFQITEDQIKNGPESDGSTNSTADGIGHIEYDTVTGNVSYDISWNNLQGFLTKIHVHGPATPSQSNPVHLIEVIEFVFPDTDPAGTVTLPSSAPLGTYTGNRTTGSFSNSHLLDPHGGFTSAEIVDIMLSGNAYVNVHSETFGMGEIRGNLPAIPEPASAAMLGLGALALIRRRRK